MPFTLNTHPLLLNHLIERLVNFFGYNGHGDAVSIVHSMDNLRARELHDYLTRELSELNPGQQRSYYSWYELLAILKTHPFYAQLTGIHYGEWYDAFDKAGFADLLIQDDRWEGEHHPLELYGEDWREVYDTDGLDSIACEQIFESFFEITVPDCRPWSERTHLHKHTADLPF